jgi:hypothetical protein
VNPLAWLGGLAVVGLGAMLLADDNHDAPTSSGGGYAPAPSGATGLPELTCSQAFDNIPDQGLRDGVLKALAASNNAPALQMLALSLESAAGSPGLSTVQRAALMKAAQCVRDRASFISLSPALTLPPSGASVFSGAPAPLQMSAASPFYKVSQA